MGKLSCGAQFDTGFSPFITEVRGRRFPLVDEERGLVLSFLSFDHSGRIKNVQRTDGTIAKVAPPVRHALYVSHRGGTVQDSRWTYRTSGSRASADSICDALGVGPLVRGSGGVAEQRVVRLVRRVHFGRRCPTPTMTVRFNQSCGPSGARK